MLEVVQAPVSRDMLQQWVEDRHGVLMDVRHDDIELRLYNEAIFPEISVLFMGDTSKYLDAVEICGMYDTITREFRFVSGQLAAIVDGIPEAERWTGPDESEDIYAEICRYAKEAVEQRGYKFEDSSSAIYAGLRQTVQSGLSDMIDYAAVLSARGEQDAVLDMRDLALEMLHFWRDPVYDTYEKGYDRLEQQYTEKLDQAVQQAGDSRQCPPFDEQKAANILGCLAIHAEEVTQNNDNFSIWECCRLAKRLREEFPQQAGIFQGDFVVDESERFAQFGSKNWEQLQEGWLLGKPVLVFSHPVPEEQVPEGWHSYHLAGRNLYRADKLLKDMPESGYVGTVLSPYSLIRASYQSRQIQNRFGCCGGYVSVAEFCECQRQCDFVIFRRTGNVRKWRVKVYSL